MAKPNPNIASAIRLLTFPTVGLILFLLLNSGLGAYSQRIALQDQTETQLQQAQELLIAQQHALTSSTKQLQAQQDALASSTLEIGQLKEQITKPPSGPPVKTSPAVPKPTTEVDYSRLPLRSVVRLVCIPDLNALDEVITGSGVSFDGHGAIVTNAHVVGDSKETTCFVALQKDLAKAEVAKYSASVIYLNTAKDEAIIQVDDEVPNGAFPETLRFCKDGEVAIGDKLVIAGYPSIGGFSITVTEGIVSGFVGNNYIKTSAKVEHGNSGGAAFRYDGCLLGIPTAVSVGDAETLGLILKASVL